MIDLNKLAEELHAAAVEKGFWDVEAAEVKHLAKMHSELSEAVQEDRCGRPLLYVDDIEAVDRITGPAMFDGRKPEGVAAELADFVMMALDWAAHLGLTCDFEQLRKDIRGFDNGEMELCGMVLSLHNLTCDLGTEAAEGYSTVTAFALVAIIELWLEIRGICLWEVIRLKMEYNRSRPALHGRLY